jgi:hypothetical protein
MKRTTVDVKLSDVLAAGGPNVLVELTGHLTGREGVDWPATFVVTYPAVDEDSRLRNEEDEEAYELTYAATRDAQPFLVMDESETSYHITRAFFQALAGPRG